MSRAAGRILHTTATEGVEQDYQSAAPFVTIFNAHESWFDAATGVERVIAEMRPPGFRPVNRGYAFARCPGQARKLNH